MSEDPRIGPHVNTMYPLTGRAGHHNRTRKATLGEGAFGRVNHERVAEGNVATKYFSPDTVCENATEIAALKLLQGLPYVAQLIDVVSYPANKPTELLRFPGAMMGKGRSTLADRRLYGSWDDVFNVIHQILLGYHVLHTNNLAHRDTKPANMLMMEPGEVWITDFGMARYIPTYMSMPRDLYTGTKPYAAPELLMAHSIKFRAPFDFFKSDAWAVGVSLYELITQRPLFDGEHDDTILFYIFKHLGTPGPEDGLFARYKEDLQRKVHPFAPPSKYASATVPAMRFASNLVAGAVFKPPDSDTLNQVAEVVAGLCTLDPEKRLTIAEALAHPVFGGAPSPLPPVKTITEQYMKHVVLSPDLAPRTLDILFDWLYNATIGYKMTPFVYDRTGVYLMAYLNNHPTIPSSHIQLLGVTALYLAICFFSDVFMELKDVVALCDYAFTAEHIRACASSFMFSPIDFFGRTFFDELLEHMGDKSNIQTLGYLNFVCFQKYLFPRDARNLPLLRDIVLKYAALMDVPFTTGTLRTISTKTKTDEFIEEVHKRIQ